MWQDSDNQEVGLEAAILQRKRNSSLVKSGCAENVTGLKPDTEATGAQGDLRAVGERPGREEARSEGLVDLPEVLMPI
jgi:hypothetical protein